LLKRNIKKNHITCVLNDTQLRQIANLSQSNKGKKWLHEAGFKTSEEVQKYATGRNFSNWENEDYGFKMQVATYQYAWKMKNNPGYHKAISVLGIKGEIYQNDADVWEKTLATPKNKSELTRETKNALAANNQRYKKETSPDFAARKGQGYLGSEDDLIQRQSSAMAIVKRIFILLQQGLTFSGNKGKTWEQWTEPVAVALSHGGRVNIRIPKIGQGEEQHGFFNWLTGGRQNMQNAGMHTRTAGTHRIAIGNDKENKKGSFKEKGGMLAAVQAGLGAEIGDTYHFGLDLPVGGLGQQDMNGTVILPNGSYGHLYIGYKPPTTTCDGGLLIGCETDAPGMTNFLGHKHTAKATSAEHGPTRGLKVDAVGGKAKGNMLVDLSAMSRLDAQWMEKLTDMEENIKKGQITTKELVGKRLNLSTITDNYL
jgi:hypothetical protein